MTITVLTLNTVMKAVKHIKIGLPRVCRAITEASLLANYDLGEIYGYCNSNNNFSYCDYWLCKLQDCCKSNYKGST